MEEKKAKKSNDKKIFKKVKRRDKNAFIKAYDLYVDQIYRFIFFKVNNREEAQDLTSLVFLKTWDYIQKKSISEYKTLKALFYSIAKNSVIDYYRKKKIVSVPIHNNLDNKNDKIADEKEDLFKKMEIQSDIEFVITKIRSLKDEYKEIIIMKYIDELEIAEIAQIINKNKGNTRVLLHRALKSLKALLNKNGE